MRKSKNNHKLLIEYLRGVDKVKWTESILDRFAMGADLPGEKMPGLPLLEIVGQHRVLIENHKGVIAYGCNEICVKVNYGVISVCGSKLMMAKMTKDQLVITGVVDSVNLRRRCT